jgi:hypothetical protein
MTTDTDQPLLYCPIDLVPHPGWKQAQAGAFAWMSRCRLFDDTSIPREGSVGTNSAQVTGSMIPTASHDRLLFYTTFMYWGFVVDDAFDLGAPTDRVQRYRALCPPVMRALESPWARVPENDHPAVTLLRELRLSMDGCFTASQTRLWIDTIYSWLLGCGLELSDAVHATTLGVDEYLFMVLYSNALRPVTVTLEICGSTGEVPAREREDPKVVALGQMAGVLMALYADLFSAGKEGPDDQNMINSMIGDADCTASQAVTEIVAICERIMVAFLRLRDQVLPGVSEHTRIYLTNLGYAVRGVLDWCHDLPRFTPSSANPLPRFAPLRVERPTDPEPVPLPYRSIAWWWDQLNP